MAKAAAFLNISQPAISKAIASLETTLRVRLLDRNPQGVELTIFGRALLDGGIAVFDELIKSVKQIEYLTDPTGGEVSIGCTEAGAAGFVPTVIAHLSQIIRTPNFESSRLTPWRWLRASCRNAESS